MNRENMVESIADRLVEDHVALMTENRSLQSAVETAIAERDTLLADLSDFVKWFNKTYPAPSNHPDHPWSVAVERLQAFGATDRRA